MLLKNLNIEKPIKGIIHIGAHKCEEKPFYNNVLKVDDKRIVWIDAIQQLIAENKKKNPNIRIFWGCLSDKDDEEIEFKITNNLQSSSILDMKEHLKEHPQIVETKRIKMKTKKLTSLMAQHNINPNNFNFINLDIQGAELLALKGAGDLLKNIDYIYTEVNQKELYAGCALLPEIDEYLKAFGFKRKNTIITKYGWGDAFYTK